MQCSVARTLSRRAVLALAASACLRSGASTAAVPRYCTYQRMVVPAFTNAVRFYAEGHGGEEPASRSGQYLLDKEDVLTRVLEVVKNFEKVDASKVTPESHFVNDLGLNSLDVVEVVFAIEQEFILDIPDHDAEKIQSIPDAVEYIAQNPMAK